ncbi:substrate-binding periplasmic protein [Nitrospirillum sp. BR 11163]|uniref:substrate-binding periplasmic protein n=1 Tax=Nitrospirillum sp. BR 11163 TaxID=3104323 RepID=UPI002AFF226F|nr:transporter substrate-binding domain-containing protein [Nitrospirillum sp. BR 11163]MEA1674023.1 transporter substrate-binding domain-containing protein [Nitrospirillum sp. BR 11163]
MTATGANGTAAGVITRRGILCGTLGSAALWAAGGHRARAQTPAIRIGGNPAWFPYSWEEGDRLRGMGVDKARAALGHLGLAAAPLAFGRWQRALAALEHGLVDLLVSALWNAERTDRMLYTAPYANDDVRAFVRRADVGRYRAVADLFGRAGVAPLGSAYGADMDALEARGLNLERSGTTEGMLQRVRYGRADFCVLVHRNGLHLLETLRLAGELAPLPFALAPVQIRMLIRRDGPLAGRLEALNTLITDT